MRVSLLRWLDVRNCDSAGARASTRANALSAAEMTSASKRSSMSRKTAA